MVSSSLPCYSTQNSRGSLGLWEFETNLGIDPSKKQKPTCTGEVGTWIPAGCLSQSLTLWVLPVSPSGRLWAEHSAKALCHSADTRGNRFLGMVKGYIEPANWVTFAPFPHTHTYTHGHILLIFQQTNTISSSVTECPV